MKNKLILACLLFNILWCSNVNAQNQSETFLPNDKQNERTSSSTIVFEEDFSLFVNGTEDEPDDEVITTTGYKIQNQYTHQPNWKGHYVFQAGGCAFIAGYTDEYDWQYYGYISTPEAELSGDLEVTFRARRANSNPDSGLLDLALCDNDFGRIETIKYQLTTEWQEFTWNYTNTVSFSDRCIFQFSAKEGEILLDDIKVCRTANVIESVAALSPINNSTTEFVARWESYLKPDISGYLFNVYYMEMPEGDIISGSMTCDFESVNVQEGSDVIDSTDPGYPEGWDIDVTSNGEKDVCTEEGNFNSGSKALLFDAAGDYIMTPISPAPINALSFWVKPTSLQFEVHGETSLLGVHVKYSDDTWEHIANIDNTYMESNGGVFTLDGDAIKPGVNQVKLICQSSYDVDFIIDDVTIDYETQEIAIPLIVDEFTTETSRVVSDIDPSKDHYYYVQVTDGNITSVESQHIWVDGIIGITPEIYPATDITENSFTANWQKIHHADNYTINIEHEFVTTTDNEEVVLTEEDFSGFTNGTLDWPHYEYWDTYNLADNDFTEQEWFLTLPCWANGHAGTQGSPWGEPSLILSPKFNLGNYAVKVDFTAYNTILNDTIYVIVIDRYDADQPKYSMKAAGFGSGKEHVTASVTIEAMNWGNEPLHIGFVSQNNNAFFLDEAKISLIVPEKGTTIKKNYKKFHANDNTYSFTDLPKSSTKYEYTIQARATKDFYVYESEISELMTVQLLSSVPTNLVATTESSSSISLTWTGVTDATSYNIYQNEELLTNVNETSYLVENLDPSTEYCYSVTAILDGVETEHSNNACATTAPDGIEETLASLNIYPNPANEKLIIEANDNIERIDIYTTTGIMVYSHDSNISTIDISDLGDGLYILKVKTTAGVATKLFVKE